MYGKVLVGKLTKGMSLWLLGWSVFYWSKGAMDDMKKKIMAGVLTMVMVAGITILPWAFPSSSYGESATGIALWETDSSCQEVEKIIRETAGLLQKQVPEPTISSIGGEWTILGVASSGAPVPNAYLTGYKDRVWQQVIASQGILTQNKYTEYSRLILALTAIGEDVTKVSGINLLEKLTDLSLLKKQGINGPVYALLALDSHGYPEADATGTAEPVTRQALLHWILQQEITAEDGIRGGFSLGGGAHADADITGMVLQALAPYRNQGPVSEAIDRGLKALNRMEKADGSFESWGTETSESIVQVIVAKGALGMDAGRHVEALLKYYKKGYGFEHVIGDGGSLLATEQALYALTAYKLQVTEGRSLYNMKHISISTTMGIQVLIDGKALAFDQPPINVGGRVLVPFRAIFEAFGAEVSWDPLTREVSGSQGEGQVLLKIGDVNASVNGKPVLLDVPARIQGGRTLVPIRFVAEGLNAQVEWDQKSQTVIITR